MRIVAWNICQPRDRERNQAALSRLRPDIAVIAERRRDLEAPAGCSVWVGEDSNKNKGLAVLSFGDYRATLHPAYDPAIRWAAPVLVTAPHSFFLLAIWTMKPYRRSLQDALDRYHELLTDGPAVVAGDLNASSASMFRMRGGARCAAYGDSNRQRDANLYLGDLPLISAYHKFFKEAPGAERQATLHHLFKENKRSIFSQNKIYHYDFCFISESWSGSLESVRVGKYKEWVARGSRFSDHVPLTVDLSLA